MKTDIRMKGEGHHYGYEFEIPEDLFLALAAFFQDLDDSCERNTAPKAACEDVYAALVQYY